MKDTALLTQLLSQLFTVQIMKSSPVTEKHDLIGNLSSQIVEQEPDASISEIVRTAIFMRSLPFEYDTTIEILTKRDKFPTFFEVFQSACATETKLSDPEYNQADIEIANSVGKGHLKVCWVCCGNHVKLQCPKWLATEERKSFKSSGLSWHQWKEGKMNIFHQANAANIRATINDFNVVRYSDSESESERSTYLCARASKS
ncbi:hypothetical protein K3495_g2951 [Podosphaera aphanis]|nr:hypothetical protein K3495_g2951 [Podosphaera aphanis]